MVEREVKELSQPEHDTVGRGFEQRLLQSELISSRRVTLCEVLNKEGRDLSGLLDASINFQARDLEDAIGYIASFQEDQASLGAERLVHVLKNAKPLGKDGQRRMSQDRGGIVGDWQIMQKRMEGSGIYGWLYDNHTTPESFIAKHFEEFGRNHFRQLWKAMHTTVKDYAFVNLRFRYNHLMSEEKALEIYGLGFLKSNFLRFLRITDNSFRFRDALGQFLKRETNVAIPDLSGDFRFSHNSRALFGTFTDEMQEKLIADFYKQLDDDKRKKLIYQAVSLCNSPHNEQTILIDKNGNPHDMYEGILIGDGRWISRISDNEVEVRGVDCYIRVRFEQDEKTGHKEKKIVGSHIDPQEDEITPVIVWKKDKTTGKKEYFCGKISDDLIQAFPDMFSQRHDTLLGQIVVAGYSDELKRILPTKLPLVKGGRKQDMLEPQMPVFVKLFQNGYLNMSPAILGFEDLGDKR